MQVPLTPFAQAARQVVAQATGLDPELFKVDVPPKPELGDVAIGVFAAAKALGKAPPAIAAEIAAGFTAHGLLAGCRATGPFVNFSLNRDAVLAWALTAATTHTLVPAIGTGQTICIDYSSPNISKHLAFHHIRSTCIGQALAQLHRGLGYRVVGINHLGDWGTTHGMLIAAYRAWGDAYPTIDITALNALYVRFREEAKTDAALAQRGRDAFLALERGEPEARALWQRFRDVSWAEFEAIYRDLGIQFDEVRGESAYEPDLPGIVAELTAKGLLSESEGAQVVQLPDEKVPMLVTTKDGTTLYATRDLAAAKYRWNTYAFARSLYVVDRGQAMHFRQLFKALTLAGYDWAARCEHVPFGLVRIGGKKTGTRAGNVVLLKDVFAEAAADVRTRIAESNPTMPEAELEATAKMVGIGGVVFANLIPQREKDVDFDWDKILSLQGDSGPYLQYSHARCASIVRRATEAGWVTAAPDIAAPLLTTDLEWAVAKRLTDLGSVVARAAAACEPHTVGHYLLELAGDFSRWYTAGNGDPALRVLCEDPALRSARLCLVAAVRAVLADGLALLGLGAPDAM